MTENILLNQKTAKLVVATKMMNEPYGQAIARKTDTTYSHTCKTMTQLEEKGLVNKSKKGRKQVFELTDKGKELASVYEDLLHQAGEELPRPPLIA